jgi:hypothetical protein
MATKRPFLHYSQFAPVSHIEPIGFKIKAPEASQFFAGHHLMKPDIVAKGNTFPMAMPQAYFTLSGQIIV